MRRTGFAIVLVAAATALTGAAPGPSRAEEAAGMARTGDTFCGDLQRSLTGATVPAATVVHATYESFKASKPEVQPLRTEQYVEYEDAEKRHPMRLSCKLKSPDIILKEYGPGTAVDGPAACGDVNRQIVAAVVAALPPADKAALKVDPARIVYDPDDHVLTGEKWIQPFPFAYAGKDGALHLRAKLLRVDWNNKLFALAPERMRGTLYCHLIAPEYAARLLTGAAAAPAAAD
jgi:hypothetical protein